MVLLEELDALDVSAALDVPLVAIGGSGGAAEEQAANRKEETMIKISAFQAIVKLSFVLKVDESPNQVAFRESRLNHCS